MLMQIKISAIEWNLPMSEPLGKYLGEIIKAGGIVSVRQITRLEPKDYRTAKYSSVM